MATPAPPSPSPASARAITFAWVVRMRWWAVLGQSVTIAVASLGLALPLPEAALAALIVVLAVSNLALEAWRRRGGVPSERSLALVFTLDILLLTALLGLSGGPSNPFSIFYLVQVTLAALVLGVGYAAAFVALSAAAYAALFVLHVPVPGMEHGGGHGAHAGHDAATHAAHLAQGHGVGLPAGGFSTHLYGMWVAFSLAAGLIAYFVARLAAALRRREVELAEAQRVALRNERLASLSTLAAGAAHELGTPLGTIAIAARELERALAVAPGESEGAAALADDARLIRREVDRCREVLARLGTQAGESPGEMPEAVTADGLVRALQERLGPRGQGRLDVRVDDAGPPVVVPVQALTMVLANLVHNGLDALGSNTHTAVRLVVRGDPEAVSFLVEDDGIGMAPDVLARAGEPFFTTKGPNAGMGLGVFLARGVAESLGGALALESVQGRGTTVTLRVPRAPGRPRTAGGAP